MSKRKKVQLHKERALPTTRKLSSWKYCIRSHHHLQWNYGENIGIDRAETTFKKIYGNHKRSFNLAAYKNDTELSKEFWKIKSTHSVPQIKWSILRKCSRFNHSSLRYNLCLNEKLEIALFKVNNILNRRTELISKCRHINKHTLLRHDTKD